MLLAQRTTLEGVVATNPKVLLVDDDRELLESFEMASEGSPFQFRFAGGADEAIAMAEAERPDIVVADYRIPGPIDGIGLLEAIGDRWPQANRVLLSGSPPVGVGHLENVQVLLKPCSFDELLATLLKAGAAGHS